MTKVQTTTHTLGPDDNAGDLVDRMAREYMRNNGGPYRVALRAILDQHPDLAKLYNDEHPARTVTRSDD